MSTHPSSPHPLRRARQAKGWSQEELAQRAGISRAAVGAIEQGRVTPSVQSALDLARALRFSVEQIFGEPVPEREPRWYRVPSGPRTRFWHAEVNGQTWRYPVESTNAGELPPHGLAAAPPSNDLPNSGGDDFLPDFPSADRVLVMASCDPSVGLLAREYSEQTPFHLVPLPRSSRAALRMLADGQAHVAGLHLGRADQADGENGNRAAAASELASPFALLRIVEWEAGLAFDPRLRLRSIKSALQGRLTWIGREEGSGARAAWDELSDGSPSPKRMASDHRGVATAICSGWADAGICLRLVSEEADLGFLSTRAEHYDLCIPSSLRHDPRLEALVDVVRSHRYRRLLGTLPGFDTKAIGDEAPC